MKWNIKLTIIAVGFILINILFAWHASTMSGGSALIYVLIYPIFWLITLILVSILTYRKRKEWLKKEMRFSTILMLLFCTPAPCFAFAELTRPEITRSSSGYFPENGKTYKTETWIYEPGVIAIKKYWILDSGNWNDIDENEFKKDSTWIYLNKKGDTLKTEKYKNDSLIEFNPYEN